MCRQSNALADVLAKRARFFFSFFKFGWSLFHQTFIIVIWLTFKHFNIWGLLFLFLQFFFFFLKWLFTKFKDEKRIFLNLEMKNKLLVEFKDKKITNLVYYTHIYWKNNKSLSKKRTEKGRSFMGMYLLFIFNGNT